MRLIGETCTCKLFSMAGPFAQQEVVTEQFVLCVKVYILIEKIKLILQKLNLIQLESIIIL